MQRLYNPTVAVFALIMMTAIWGSTFTLVKWTVATVDVYAFVAQRFALATFIMALLFHRRLRFFTWNALKDGVILGLLLGIALIAQTEGLRFTTASNSSLITGLYMVVIPILSIRMTRERPTSCTIAGIALA